MYQGGLKVENYNEWPTGQWYCSQQRSRAQFFLCIIAPHLVSTSSASNDLETSFQLTLCVYNLLVVTVLRPKDDVGAEFCIWFLTRCSAAGRLVVGLHTSLAPLTVARELQNRKCWTDELQQRPHFIRSIRKWTEASTSVPCGQLLLGLIWKVIGIDFEFVELFRVT